MSTLDVRERGERSQAMGERRRFGPTRRFAAGLAGMLLMLLAACSSPVLEGWGDEGIRLLVQEPVGDASLESQTLRGRVAIVAETSLDVVEMRFFVNDEQFRDSPHVVDREGPFGFELNTNELGNGEHIVSVAVVVSTGDAEINTMGATDRVRVRHARFRVSNPSPSPTTSGEMTLRADPAFEESTLSAERRVWYRRVWAAIEHPDAQYPLWGLASTGNLQNYGYDFNQQMSLLLMALRSTRDPRLVDVIAGLSDRMADALVTEWYDYASESWVTPDDGTAGLRRFLYYKSSDTRFGGKDTQVLRALLSHGMIANMAYALEANRGIASPSGLDYGARADFWKDYLKNDFEAIWRIRENRAWPSFPLWTHQISHSFKSQMRWAYYMYKLTGERPYLESAMEYADTVLRNAFEVDSPTGPAIVWSHKIKTPDYGLQPIAYARLDYAIEADMALDGGLEGIDTAYMGMHGRSLAHFVLDNHANDMSFDVGGMRDRTGTSLRGGTTATLPTKDPWTGSGLEYRRESMDRFAISFVAPMAAFAESDHISSVAHDVYRSIESDVENPTRLAIPVGMLLATP